MQPVVCPTFIESIFPHAHTLTCFKHNKQREAHFRIRAASLKLSRPRLRKTTPPAVITMSFELPKLTYNYNALEPFVDTDTMNIHHTKHHQAYINNINNYIDTVRSLMCLYVGGWHMDSCCMMLIIMAADVFCVNRTRARRSRASRSSRSCSRPRRPQCVTTAVATTTTRAWLYLPISWVTLNCAHDTHDACWFVLTGSSGRSWPPRA